MCIKLICMYMCGVLHPCNLYVEYNLYVVYQHVYTVCVVECIFDVGQNLQSEEWTCLPLR